MTIFMRKFQFFMNLSTGIHTPKIFNLHTPLQFPNKHTPSFISHCIGDVHTQPRLQLVKQISVSSGIDMNKYT